MCTTFSRNESQSQGRVADRSQVWKLGAFLAGVFHHRALRCEPARHPQSVHYCWSAMQRENWVHSLGNTPELFPKACHKGLDICCNFSSNLACNSCRSRIKFYFCDFARNKLHRVTPRKNLVARNVSRKVELCVWALRVHPVSQMGALCTSWTVLLLLFRDFFPFVFSRAPTSLFSTGYPPPCPPPSLLYCKDSWSNLNKTYLCEFCFSVSQHSDLRRKHNL